MKKNFALFIAIALLFLLIGVYFGAKRFSTEVSEPASASKLFAQTLSDEQGKLQSLSQWENKRLVVNFWATWCAPCVQEMPELTQLQAELAPKNVQIIGIGIDSAANIKEFALKYKIGYPLYIGGIDATELSREFGNKAGGLPFTVLVTADGQIKKTYLGRLKMNELRRDIASL